jgi:cytochrome oxidase Cu insertion factor (SCO1/SenC/PrrC family)
MPPLNVNERQRVCGTFNLTDHHGRSVSNESFRGRFMLIFFRVHSLPHCLSTRLD